MWWCLSLQSGSRGQLCYSQSERWRLGSWSTTWKWLRTSSSQVRWPGWCVLHCCCAILPVLMLSGSRVFLQSLFWRKCLRHMDTLNWQFTCMVLICVHLQVSMSSGIPARTSSVRPWSGITGDICATVLLWKKASTTTCSWMKGMLCVCVCVCQSAILYQPRGRGDNTFGSVRVCVCVCPFHCGHSCLNHLTLIFGMRVDLDLG